MLYSWGVVICETSCLGTDSDPSRSSFMRDDGGYWLLLAMMPLSMDSAAPAVPAPPPNYLA